MAEDLDFTQQEEASLLLVAQVTCLSALHPDFQIPFQDIQELLQVYRPADILSGTTCMCTPCGLY
jgi:hypothetical protein